MNHHPLKWGLLVLAALLASQGAQAAKIQIWPIKLSLWPAHATESVRLTNKEDTPVSVQISAKSWDMDEDGRFVETDTGDFVFFPRLLTLPPHEEKLVRIGYEGDFPALEKPYRLLIQELPAVRTPEEQAEGKQNLGLTYTLRLSVPLFVMPGKEPPSPEIVIDGLELTTAGVKLGVKAAGTHHVQVNRLELQLMDGAETTLARGENKVHLLRVLPQRRVFVEVPLDRAACAKATSLLVKVDAERLKQPYEQRIPLAGGRCQPVN
jgi:fimbrial chaperone protein